MARRRRQAAQQFLKGLNIVGLAKKVAPPVVFVSALTADIQNDINSQPNFFGKLKTITNAITGRTTNLNLFNDAPKYAMKINPSGMWNPFTQSAVTMIAAGFAGQYLGKRLGIPGLGKLGQLKGLGGAVLPAALAGGLFDDTPQGFNNPFQSTNTSQQRPASFSSGSSAGYNTRNYSYSAMHSTSSGSVTRDISGGAF